MLLKRHALLKLTTEYHILLKVKKCKKIDQVLVCIFTVTNTKKRLMFYKSFWIWNIEFEVLNATFNWSKKCSFIHWWFKVWCLLYLFGLIIWKYNQPKLYLPQKPRISRHLFDHWFIDLHCDQEFIRWIIFFILVSN